MPKTPPIKSVARWLTSLKGYLDSEVTEIDVRLQVYPDGEWAVRPGDSSYDLDHRGYWGCSTLDKRTNCRELARDLIDQCAEEIAMMGN